MSIDLKRDALQVAPDLLNCYLCVRQKNEVFRSRITEVEAYHGFEDKASHAHRGRTPRNNVMFGPEGHWYVYLCYGVHWLLNLVTGEMDYPSAVLIRGIQGVSGPGRVTKHLGIDKQFNEQSCSEETGLFIETVPLGMCLSRTHIEATPRIGVGYAGEEWASKPWRFLAKTNE